MSHRRGEAQQDQHREALGHGHEQERTVHARGRVEPAAEQRSRHARPGTRDRIEAHRRTEARAARDVREQRPPHGEVHRPGDARQECPDRHMPDLKPAKQGERRERPGEDGQTAHGPQQQAPSVEAARDLPAERAEEGQRQHAQHQHRGHQEWRSGDLEHEDADREHLEPPRRRPARTGQPQAQEVRIRQQRPRRAPRRRGARGGHV